MDVWDNERFGRVTFENAFQGSEISSVHGYHIFEDITALYPQFQTDLMLSTGYGRVIRYGDFIDTFMPRLRNEYTEHFDYGDIALPIYPFMRMTNSLADNDKSVLIIAESNGLLQSTFLSLGFANLDMIYLIYEVTPDWLWYVLENNDYDYVIMVVSDVVLAQQSMEAFEQDRLFLGHPPY